MPDLDVVRAKVFDLYQQQKYQQGLVIAQGVAETFPASSSYWIACLQAVQGQRQQALDALQDGLNKGAWWSALMLEKDPDLESIRQSEDFARIQAESTRRWKEAFRPEPDIVVHTPETSPPHVLLIALHGMGSGEEAGTFANHWSAALDTGAVVAVPQSSQPHSPDGGWTWADESQTDADLRFVYDRITSEHDIDPRRVVLAGFSQGGRVAISAALRQHPIPACGFIAVAPAIRDHPIDRDLTGPSLRARIIVGEQDWVLDSVQTLYATAIDQGQQWSLETVRDLGHDFPPDFTDRLMSALTFTIDYSA